MTLLAFLFPFLLFVAYPSRMWNFDGVACAAALELGNPVFFFHSNHLLYGALGFLFWQPLSWLGLLRALPALQLFTSLLSAAGLIGLYKLLTGILDDQRMALLLTLVVSATAVLWVWSAEAQVYALAFLAISWATYELFKPGPSKKGFRVGWLHAAAVLGHIVHVLWIVPALYWMGKEQPPERRQHIRDYLLALSVGVVVPYLLVIGWMLMVRQTPGPWLMKWLMGSIALNPNSVFQWHFTGWTGPLAWAATTPRIFWGSFWPYHITTPLWCWLLTAASVGAVLVLLGMSWKRHNQRPWVFSVLWLAVYGVFFWTWEPTTECYRMTDIIPLAILLALGLTAFQIPAWRWATLLLLVVTLLPTNFITRIAPMHNPEQNLLYQDILALTQATPTNSLYLTAGGLRWIYLLYFSGRSAWNVNTFLNDPARLSADVERHRGFVPVFIQDEAAHIEGVQSWLSRYKLRPVDHLAWAQLQ